MNRTNEYLTELKTALKNKEFVVYYQPVFNIKTNRLIGCEALAKWEKPDDRLINPSEFIEYMENKDIISSLDYYIFEEVCSWIYSMTIKDIPVCRIYCNISGCYFGKSNFITDILDIIGKYSISTESIGIEITENTRSRNDKITAENIAALERSGISVMLDDYGTGFTSEKDLITYPISCIKIDKKLLDEADTDNNYNTIKNIINMGHSMNKFVLCEGIESREQLGSLVRMDCDAGQGYYCINR